MSRFGDKYTWLRKGYYEDEEENIEGYDHMDDIPHGWCIAFGDMFLEELDNAIRNAKLEDEYKVYQAKEKFGQLEWYSSPTTPEINDIIRKYEVISANVCIVCGKPNVYMLTKLGWISPFCEKCFKEYVNDTRDYRDVIGGNGKILNVMKYRQYSNNFEPKGWRDFEVDISDTVKKVEQRWNERS